MSIQVLPQKYNPGARIGQALGMGLVQGTERAAQADFTKGRLQEAFGKLDPNGNFIEQLKTIAPDLLSTPGGAQALSELAPLLGKFANQQAYTSFINSRKGESGTIPGQSNEQQRNPYTQQMQPEMKQGLPSSEEDRFRNPQAYANSESLYPEQTAGPQEQSERSPQQRQQRILELMEASQSTGNPISYQDAAKAEDLETNQIRQSNQTIRANKQAQQVANEALTEGMVNRAENGNLLKYPESRTVAERLALEAKRQGDPNQQWEYVRTGLRKFDQAKANIERQPDLSGPVVNYFRKMNGTYKDKDTIIRNIQPSVEQYKKYGLFNELRSELASSLGFGSDDIERTIFPLDKKQSTDLQSFESNPNQAEKFLRGPAYYAGNEATFKDKQFNSFKDKLSTYLKDHPGVNLVSMRSFLNQEKGIAWNDISKGIDELIEEKRFIPDVVQDQEKTIIDSAPLPGMAQIFNKLWTGAK